MSHPVPGPFTALDYDRAARAYLQSLPLEHFMEAVPQATQREITVESLALLKTRRPEVQSFNELLVQYFFKGQLRQVVPDNMVIRSDQPAQAVGSYNVELEPVPPFLVLEYVSPTNPRKDYKDSFRKYERELKVPYYLLFYPEKQDLRVYHHTGRRYQRLPPDGQGCIALPELDLHVGLLEGWVRYWHRGRLLKLPGELVDRMAQQAQQIRRQARHIRQLEAHVQDQATELEIKDTQLQQKEEQLSQVRELLRRQVEERARRAGRADLLARLPGTTDLGQLSRWLTELG